MRYFPEQGAGAWRGSPGFEKVTFIFSLAHASSVFCFLEGTSTFLQWSR